MELSDEDMLKVTLSDVPPEAVPNYKATVGSPLQEGIPHARKEDIIGALKAVQDPELFMNVYELGLIYDIRQEENGDVFILMTLTSPMCPIAGEMPKMAATAVSTVPGVGITTVELTFDPPWTIDRLSDEIKLMMGLD
jgi:metal-sulfur cluster biosynthetic enzyme